MSDAAGACSYSPATAAATTAASDRSPLDIADQARARLSQALILTGHEDEKAFSYVYRLTSAKLFGVCLRICGEPTAAEDVLHDVYLTVWKQAANWDPSRSSPITWLATIARNRAIDWRRAQRHRSSVSLSDAIEAIDPATDPATLALTGQQSRHIHSCLATLDERQADAIRTAFFSGLTYAELAQRAGVPLTTMKSRVRRGLANLKLSLEAGQE